MPTIVANPVKTQASRGHAQRTTMETPLIVPKTKVIIADNEYLSTQKEGFIMGWGGRLKITNGTSSTLNHDYQHSYQMNDWSFSSVNTKKDQSWYIEWSNGFFKNWGDDAGESYWSIGGLSLKLMARNPTGASAGNLSIQWSWASSEGGYYPLKPPFYIISATNAEKGLFNSWSFMNNRKIDMGFKHDGTVNAKVVDIQLVLDQMSDPKPSAMDIANNFINQKNPPEMQAFMDKLQTLYP